MRINGCLCFSFTSRSLGGGSGTLWSFSVFTNNNNTLFLVLFAQVLCCKSREVVFWIWIFLTLCLCFKICGKSWCKTCNISCSKEFLFLCCVFYLACMVVCHYKNTNVTNLAWKRNQRKWERHVFPDRFMDGNLTVLIITKTIQLSKVRFVQKQRFYSLKTHHYILMEALVTMFIFVFQYGPSGAHPGGQSKKPNKNKRKTILSWLPELPHFCHLCPWCWSTWSGPMWYDTIRLLFWRLRKCTNTHGTL